MTLCYMEYYVFVPLNFPIQVSRSIVDTKNAKDTMKDLGRSHNTDHLLMKAI